MIVSDCELTENVFSTQISNNEMRDYDPARVQHRFVRFGLADNTEQGAAREFSRVASSACVLSLRMVGRDRGHR